MLDCLKAAERLVASPLIDRASFLDALLRPRQRRNGGALHRHEDPGELVVLEVLDARDELGVPDREADAPPGHAVRLREREELEADLARALGREEALRAAPVEDEVAVRE